MTPIIENSRLSGYIGTLGSPPGSQLRLTASFVSEMLGEKVNLFIVFFIEQVNFFIEQSQLFQWKNQPNL